ncbi:CBS domain-containing protein [Nitrosopumilus sp. K4]|uniref:CBS domain-containing protein n=1 Tax=Nitrosopumilus sp. K4 TaxID=2795383 RepID=UPI001BA4BD96|nr:CBS domain-containing protein [Nitrosopumilus sp. K4]QUC64576.1 CBS domain-containing protein [Nitrosopumilus sp. K4]
MITDTIYEHLKDIQSQKVKPLISKATLIEPSETLSSVIGKLTKNNAYDAFYLNGKTTLSTNVRTLLNAKSITTMKVDPFLYPIPFVTPNNSIQKAANIIAHYRIREVPVVQKNKIVGVVTAKKILKLLSKKDNKWIKANLIYTQNPIIVSSDESLSSARKIMTSKKLDHLPVMNKGQVKQVLTSSHLLDSIIPQEKQGRKSMGSRTIHKLESRIGNIGSTRIPQCTPNDDLNKIIKLMQKTDTTCCLVNLWDNLQGIITLRDILGLLASKIETPIPLYIVGLPEDQKNVSLISKKFMNTLKRLQKVYSEIQEARVSIKQQRTGGKKEGKYEVSIMIITPHHAPMIYNSVGFDLSEVLEELSQKLLKTLSKRAKQRSKTSIRKIGLPEF